MQSKIQLVIHLQKLVLKSIKNEVPCQGVEQFHTSPDVWHALENLVLSQLDSDLCAT